MDTGLLDLDLANASGNLAFRQTAVADYLPMAILVRELGMTLDPVGDFRVNGLGEQRLSSFSKDLRQHVFRLTEW